MEHPSYRFSQVSIPEGLTERVVAHVSRARTRAARTRIAVTSTILSLSTLGALVAIRATLQAAEQSGFSTLIRLTLSDTSIIAAHLQSFALSLIETAPSVLGTLTLLLVAIALTSLRAFIRTLTHTQSPTYSSVRHA